MAKAQINTPPDCWVRLRQGDPAALGELYDAYAGKLFQVASHFTDKRELAKDALQEVFIELWTYRASIGDVTYPLAYLTRVLRSILIKRLKSQPAQWLAFEEAHIGNADSPEEELIAQHAENQLTANLDKAISRLTTRQKLILHLHYYEGLSYEQIAQRLRMNYQSVNNLAFRTIRHLRSFMSIFF